MKQDDIAFSRFTGVEMRNYGCCNGITGVVMGRHLKLRVL
jgi:hypothetical protein